ncbi:hypothetical protein DFH08DRAFT_811939 [Mycena albidolilacea]|uniref:Uncharacterized protein n=1 Tax=Mycena albidolilacea TaxID=1033008 RepID=A0AAD7EPJ7_9AGAR|nr:hypothetical protein DFH08DRAFT_811939 [Mycena albidolilacea]
MQGLRALWGDALPFPLPVDRTYFGPPRGPPWVGPIIDAMFVESVRKQKLMREGKPLPAREYSKDASPYAPHWWPESVKILHREASREEDRLKDEFRRLFPCGKSSPRQQAPQYQAWLTVFLPSCSYAAFFLRTRLQEGITASAVARAGAIAFYKKIEAEEAAAITAAYVNTLMSDDFLAMWVACSTEDVHLWGTNDDPRNPPNLAAGGSGWTTGGWGTGTGGWGTGGCGTGTGGWGGGWGWTPPVRKRRWFPCFYGYRRMGAVFRQPRSADWREHRHRRFAWVRQLERRWRRHNALALSFYLVSH